MFILIAMLILGSLYCLAMTESVKEVFRMHGLWALVKGTWWPRIIPNDTFFPWRFDQTDDLPTMDWWERFELKRKYIRLRAWSKKHYEATVNDLIYYPKFQYMDVLSEEDEYYKKMREHIAWRIACSHTGKPPNIIVGINS